MVDQDQSDNIQYISVFITTSRNPTHFLRRVSKVLEFSIPNSLRMNRGSLNLKEIYRYCWNRQISYALILHGTAVKDVVEIKAYKIGKDVKSIDASIRLSDIITLKKHNREARINVDSVQLQFTSSVQQSLRKRIIQAFTPLIRSRNTNASKNFLSLRFQVIASNRLSCKAIQTTTRGILPLYNISINGCFKYD
jgi:rRNA maturation protein Rpf1